MAGAPYIPFYTSDFLGGTGGMTAATKGIYITLLCLMYENEGPIKQRWEALARRCGCTLPAFKKAILELQEDGKITVDGTELWSEKCEKHVATRRERSASARSSANKRWEKSEQKQQANDATALRSECYPEPEPDIKEDTNVSSKKRASRLPEDWALPSEYRDWAKGEGYADAVINSQAERFRDYWISLSGQKASKLDWLATWRNWMRNAPRSVPPNSQQNQISKYDRMGR